MYVKRPIRDRKTERFRHLHDTWYMSTLIMRVNARTTTYVLRGRSYLFTGSYDTNTSLTITAKLSHRIQQSMFDEYYVVHIVLSMSTNECDHNNKYAHFIIARSFVRPPSLLLLCPMVIGMTLCFAVMNTVVVVHV